MVVCSLWFCFQAMWPFYFCYQSLPKYSPVISMYQFLYKHWTYIVEVRTDWVIQSLIAAFNFFLFEMQMKQTLLLQHSTSYLFFPFCKKAWRWRNPRSCCSLCINFNLFDFQRQKFDVILYLQTCMCLINHKTAGIIPILRMRKLMKRTVFDICICEWNW